MPDWDRDDPTAVWFGSVPGQGLTRDKKGIVASLRNVERALTTPGWWRRIGWDAFRCEVMWCDWESAAAGRAQWRSWGDEDSVQARMALEAAGFQPVGRELLRDALGVVAHACEFDSAQTWLAGLAWDGTARVERFLVDFAGAADTPYVRAAGAYLWAALAGRVLQPGVKADMVPILVGAGGAGKTTLVRALAPAEEFAGRLHLSAADADVGRTLRGKLVVELAELRGLKGRDSESVKTFMDATHDEWVPKYREYAEKSARRCVFIGTTDKQDFLADSAGNERRWLPVAVGVEKPMRAPTSDELAQLWAEGAARFLGHVDGVGAGVAWRDVHALAAGGERDAYLAVDVVQELLEAWVESPVAGGEDGVQGVPDASYPQAGGATNGHAMTWGERGFTTAEAILWGLRGSIGSVGRAQEEIVRNSLARMKFVRKKETKRGALRNKWIWLQQ